MNQAQVLSPTPPINHLIESKPTPVKSKKVRNHSVTELVLTQHSGDEVMLLLPMLAHLCRVADRWITWITPHKIDRQLLESFGVDTQKIRLIHCTKEQESRKILWEALSLGSSHTVVASPGALSDQALNDFQKAAEQGDSHGLLVRYREI